MLRRGSRTALFAAAIAGCLAAQAPVLAQTGGTNGNTPTGTAGTAGSADANATPAEPGAGAAPIAGGTATVSSNDYRLQPGDRLRVEVYKDQQLSQSLQVRPDGKITLPLLGDIPAAGKTPMELRDQLATGFKEYVTNPVVTVIVVEATSPVVYVMGEVNSPGPIRLRAPITVMQALAMAGGFKDFANLKDIRILRDTPNGTETAKFNYKDALKGDVEPIYLRGGETIVVP